MATKTITQINRNLTGITYSGMSNSYIEVEVYDETHSGVSCKTNFAYLKTALTNTYDITLSGLSTAVSTNTSGINTLSIIVSNEISNRISGDTSLTSMVSTDLSTINILSTTLSNEISNIISGDTSLSSIISIEISSRISGDTSLSTVISTNSSDLNILSIGISNEISERISSDISLFTILSSEIDSRISGDTSLFTIISSEIDSRISGDTSLSSIISTNYSSFETYTTITAPNTYEPLLPSTPSTPETKYLNGNKQWANITIGSGGYASNVYPTTLISTFYSGYSQASYINDTGTTEVIISGNSASGIVTGRTYIHDAPLDLSIVDAGIWTINFYLKIDDTNADTKIGWEILTRSTGGTETSHFIVWSPTIENTTYEILRMEYISPEFIVNPSDHMALRIYFQTTRGTNVNVTYQIGDGYGSYLNTPLNMKHSQLRGKNDEELYQHITNTQLGILTGVTSNVTSLSTVISNEISTRTSVDTSLISIVLTGATNGLSLYNKSVGLGGELNELITSIDVNNKELSFLLSKNSFVSGSGFDSELYSIILQPDGKILCGGNFTSYSGVTANHIIRLNSNGSIDNTFITDTGFDNVINDITLQPDGKILVSGIFTTYSGITANRIIRLNSDGSIDNSFITDTGFDGVVATVILQLDGKILCGGYFTSYSGVTANKIIRLNSDGSIDNSFVIGSEFNNYVKTIALQSDDKILIGGGFTSYSGITANHIIRLNSDGSIDNTFVTDTGFDQHVITITLQSDNKILCGGDFTSYSGVTANYIIRLNSDGSIDNTFITNTGFDNTVGTITFQSDGKILVGGYFTSYSGVTSNYIIRLNSDGSIDNTFVTGTGFDLDLYPIILQPDGKILCGGFFTTYSGITSNRIIRLNSDGSIDNIPILNEIILKNNLIEYLNDASDYYTDRSLVDKGYVDKSDISLSTTLSNEISTRTSADLSLATVVLTGATNGLSLYDKSVGLGGQLSATTLIDVNNKELSFLLSNNSFVIGSGFDNYVNIFALQSDGKILVGGKFTSYSGITSNRIIRLNSDGSIDNSFITDTGFDHYVYSLTIQPDGKILVGGDFTSYSGVTANYIIRLNSDGSIDNTFVTGTGFNQPVITITLQPNGKILVGGAFTSYSGITSNRIIRLNSDGSIDNTFVTGTGFDFYVYSLTIQSDSKILVGGYFTSYSGVTANYIIRLNSDGSIDNTFVTDTGFDGNIEAIVIQSDSKILVGGVFTTYSGVTANRIIRLNSDGSIDNTFVTGTGFDGNIGTIALQPDDKILVGGQFISYSGVTANYIIRLNSDGSIDNSFVVGSEFNNYVKTIALQSDGKILCGGSFTSYSGVTANYIIRLNSDGSINNTSISNEIIFKNNLIEYLNDASDYYTDRSLVDKGYISTIISAEVSSRTSQSNTFLKLSGGTLTGGLSGTSIYLTNEIVSTNVRKITQVILNSGATTTWNMNDSCSAIVYLTGATTLSITNAVSGDNGTLVVIQGTSGDITFPNVSKYASGTVPTLTGTNGIDILSFYYDGATYFWNVGKNYS